MAKELLEQLEVEEFLLGLPEPNISNDNDGDRYDRPTETSSIKPS